MNASFLLAAGIGLSSAVTHFVLGLMRPRAVQHVTFALMMLCTCPFLLVVAELHTATSAGEAAALGRVGVALAIVLITLFGVFVRQHTGVKLHPAIGWAFLGANAAWFAYDILGPSGLLVTRPPPGPALPPFGPHGTQALLSTSVEPIGMAWQGFNALTAGWGAIVGWRTVWREGRELAFALGASALTLTVVIDVLRNLLGTSWPFLGGFGIPAMGLLLSAQLASDFRRNERHLGELLTAAVSLRDQLNTPLQTLRFGLSTLPAETLPERAAMGRLQRAVTKLSELGRELRKRPLPQP